MQAFALVRLISRARDFFPEPQRVDRLHAGAAQFGRQDPCRTQCLITKHLGHESQARATSQPEIFGSLSVISVVGAESRRYA